MPMRTVFTYQHFRRSVFAVRCAFAQTIGFSQESSSLGNRSVLGCAIQNMLRFFPRGFKNLRQLATSRTPGFRPTDQLAKFPQRIAPPFLVAANQVAEVLADVAVAPNADLFLNPIVHLLGHGDGES